MKKFILLLLAIITLTACAESKTFQKADGTTFVAEPYGWANKDSKRIDGVIYEVNAGNIALSVFGLETLFVPLYCTGWQLYEPVQYVEPKIE